MNGRENVQDTFLRLVVLELHINVENYLRNNYVRNFVNLKALEGRIFKLINGKIVSISELVN